MATEEDNANCAMCSQPKEMDVQLTITAAKGVEFPGSDEPFVIDAALCSPCANQLLQAAMLQTAGRRAFELGRLAAQFSSRGGDA